MTDHTPTGLRRPDNGATIGSTAGTLRQHANSVQVGSHNFGSPAVNAVVTGQVVFDTPFDGAPRVVVGHGSGLGGTAIQQVWATAISSSGFTVAGKNVGASGVLMAHWVAIGRGTEVGG